MKLYIIRHGETDYNVARRFQGMWGESALTENGKKQAEATKQLIGGIPFDHIYSSAAVRTRKTAALLFPERDDILFSDDLREINVGSLTNLLVADCRAQMPEKFKISDATQGYEVFGGESYDDVTNRAKSAIARIVAGGGENVAIVTHGGFIRHLMVALFDQPTKNFAICDNCAVTLVNVEENRNVLSFYNRVAASYLHPSDAF